MFRGTLYEYQAEAVDRMTDRGQMLLALCMGAGKTPTSLGAIEQLHTEGEVDRCLVVVPASLKYQWLREIGKFTDAKVTVIDGTAAKRAGLWKLSRSSRYVVVNAETLINDVKLVGTIQALILDECFPAGTLVDTLRGAVPIEEIQVGEWVRNAAGNGQVEAVHLSNATAFVRAVLDDGSELVATPEHPVLTTTGWTTMVKLSGHTLVTTREAVRMVRSGLDEKGVGNPVLQQILFSEMADQPAVVAGEGRIRFSSTSGNDSGQRATVRSVNDSDRTARTSTQGSGSLDRRDNDQYEGDVQSGWSQAQSPRGKWSRVDGSATAAVGSVRRRMDSRVLGGDWSPTTRSSHALPHRLGESAVDDGCGSGWEQSSDGEGQGAGCSQGTVSHRARVVRVEVLEQGSDDFASYGNRVYNLQVSNHPSYSVNGLLVHNCSIIKNRTTKRARLLKRIGKTVPYRFALTGQPIENRPEELFSIMEFVDKQVLGDFATFDRTFIVRDHWGRPLRYRNLDTVHRVMRECMIRKTREDIADQLPKIVHQLIPVPFDSPGAVAYRRICNDLLSEIASITAGGHSFNLWAHYNGSDGEAQGQIMARLIALRMLCDNPALVRHSAEAFSDASTSAGSQYAHDIIKMGWLNGVNAAPKLEACLEYIEDVLAEDPKNKIVLFSFFKKNLHLIRGAAKNVDSVLFTGDMNALEKDRAKEKFSTDPHCRLFLSSDAGGYGVDLPMSNYLISYDLPWSSGKLEQREARIIRLSSKFPHVTIATFVMRGSVEERIYELLQHKRSVSEAFIDGKNLDVKGGLTVTLDTLSSFLRESAV